MELQVLNDNILVKAIEEDSKNGLYVPPLFRQQAETTKLGVVAHCGPKACVNVGDTIVFGKWTGEEIVHNNVKLLIMRSRSIFAVK